MAINFKDRGIVVTDDSETTAIPWREIFMVSAKRDSLGEIRLGIYHGRSGEGYREVSISNISDEDVELVIEKYLSKGAV